MIRYGDWKKRMGQVPRFGIRTEHALISASKLASSDMASFTVSDYPGEVSISTSLTKDQAEKIAGYLLRLWNNE